MASPRLSVILSALIRKSQVERSTKTRRAHFLESLEERRCLAIASPPSQPLAVADEPIAITSGLIDSDPAIDLVSLSRTGQLSVARNGNNGTWTSVESFELGLSPTFGMVGSSLNDDAYLDLVVIGSSSARVLFGDGAGRFRTGPQLDAPPGGRWQPTDSMSTVAAVGLLNDDLQPDIVLLDTAQNRINLYYGLGNETYASPVAFPSGGIDPTALAIADVIGDTRPDIVVGHRDGTIAFLMQSPASAGSDQWSIDAAATLRHSAAIASLAAGDLNQDGATDIAVSTTGSAFVLQRQLSPLSQSPIINGNFDLGLSAGLCRPVPPAVRYQPAWSTAWVGPPS